VVDDRDARREPRAKRSDRGVYRRVFGEDQMHALGTGDGFGRRGREDRALGDERLGLGERAVPHPNRMTLPKQRLRESGTK
jgi:hypothetical protein